ncbi:hypothetical protein MW871_15690 [Flavobacterium sp. I-SCBP12n]|uniref:Uncharacterized protein n=1 Tax=Flavobacterium pygoscelis TaxID=2893176 RepID=A0A9X2BMX3_9FLAO|nr:hypothetical protein [Flavobacterium pygoscelis]MCK8143333.1 hypothetical protein [Flavobacterium pygoscelis]
MTRKETFDDETFECSRCSNVVDQFDENCDVCGHIFTNIIDFSNRENKHKAISYKIAELNGYEVLVSTLNNYDKGNIQFIVEADSQLALRIKYFVHNNKADFLENGLTQYKLIDYEDFILMELENEEYYIHKNLLNNKNMEYESKSSFLKHIKQKRFENIFVYEDDWIDLEYTLDYKNLLKECISYIRPETFFYFFYSIITYYDFEKKLKTLPNNEQLLSLFKEGSKKILKESCYVVIEKYENPEDVLILSYPWENYHINYSKLVDPLKTATQHFINHSYRIYEVLGIDKNGDPYEAEESEIFFQNLMYMGIRMAHTRIVNELNNNSNFGCEIISSFNNSELIIYLTPEGFRNQTAILKMSVEEKLKMFNSFLNENKIKRIDTDILRKKLDTNILLEYEGKIYKHYFHFSEYSNDFMSNRINKKHLSSILQEGQANFKEVIN